jgi:hypothetical protein
MGRDQAIIVNDTKCKLRVSGPQFLNHSKGLLLNLFAPRELQDQWIMIPRLLAEHSLEKQVDRPRSGCSRRTADSTVLYLSIGLAAP